MPIASNTELAAPEPAPHDHEYKPNSGCFLCRTKRPFTFPERLVDECLAGRLVIFAGAGVSTENPHVMPSTLYEDLAEAMEVDPASGMSFPSLISRFEAGNDRSALLQKIKTRFDYIDSFPETQSLTTRFHSELSTVFPVNEIITTNWDTYFERYCGATPIVEPDDYAFWTMPGRKVFKIHGSMNNIGSLVASEEDYESCYERLRTGVIGASLKHMLATKTLVFVGYSFRDEDFSRIYSYLYEEMGRTTPRSIIVTLDEDFDATAYPASTVIQTDATYFVSELKKRLLDTPHFLDDARFDDVQDTLQAAVEAHYEVTENFAATKYPTVIYTCSYQDGLLDALHRILRRKRTGEYSHVCDINHKIASYLELRTRSLRARRYEDVAYIDGYKNGLIYLVANDPIREALPLYYVFGAEAGSLTEFKRAIKKAPSLHKTAHARAKKIVAKLFVSDGLVYRHPPFFSFDP